MRKVSIILMCLSPWLGSAQVRIDTLGTIANPRLAFSEKEWYYQVEDQQGRVSYAKRYPYTISSKMDPRNPPFFGFDIIRHDDEHVFYGGKIYNLGFQPLCEERFSQVFGRVGDNYVVTKNGKCYLLTANCELRYICAFKARDEIVVPHRNGFYVFDDAAKMITTFSPEGEKLGKIPNEESAFLYQSENEYTILTLKSNRNYEADGIYAVGEYKFYDYSGNLITTGFSIDNNKEVIVIQQDDEQRLYLYKNQLIDIPDSFDEILPAASDFVTVTLHNGPVGIWSNSLADTIIDPVYQEIRFDDADYRFEALYNTGRREPGDHFFAVDANNELHIFTYAGEKIDLGVRIKKTSFFIPKLARFSLQDGEYFYAILQDKATYHLFDRAWNYVATETRSPADTHLLVETESFFPKMTIPIRFIQYFTDQPEHSTFFRVASFRKGGKNIIDSKANLIFAQNHESITQISPDHFIVQEREGEPYVIKLTARE